jgi:hypothetical protein
MDEGMSGICSSNSFYANLFFSNYLEGCMCIGVYLIIALAFYVMPEAPGDA